MFKPTHYIRTLGLCAIVVLAINAGFSLPNGKADSGRVAETETAYTDIMPHDKRGVLLVAGDLVNLPCRITHIGADGPDCNLTIEAIDAHANGYRPTVACNAKLVLKDTPVPSEPLNPEQQLQAAREAYHRYGTVTDFKNFQGNPMPTFDTLPETIKMAWVAAANPSVAAVRIPAGYKEVSIRVMSFDSDTNTPTVGDLKVLAVDTKQVA